MPSPWNLKYALDNEVSFKSAGKGDERGDMVCAENDVIKGQCSCILWSKLWLFWFAEPSDNAISLKSQSQYQF